MRRFLPLFLLLLSGLSAASVDELVHEGLAAEMRQDSPRALQLFQQADTAKPNDAFILQKIAKQYSDLVPDQRTDAAQKQFAIHALDYAQRSFALEPTNAVYALSLAICHGRLALASDTRTKVEYSRLIKEEIDRSLRLDPNYAWAHHMLGRWHGEVASLGATARLFARLFYGGIPPASVDEGIAHLRRATELEPGELNHWLDLGFAYVAAGKTEEARRAWRRGLALPVRGPHDATAQQRAREALAHLD
jgi:tetratricopeptide (TPR) repeat protein